MCKLCMNSRWNRNQNAPFGLCGSRNEAISFSFSTEAYRMKLLFVPNIFSFLFYILFSSCSLARTANERIYSACITKTACNTVVVYSPYTSTNIVRYKQTKNEIRSQMRAHDLWERLPDTPIESRTWMMAFMNSFRRSLAVVEFLRKRCTIRNSSITIARTNHPDFVCSQSHVHPVIFYYRPKNNNKRTTITS